MKRIVGSAFLLTNWFLLTAGTQFVSNTVYAQDIADSSAYLSAPTSLTIESEKAIEVYKGSKRAILIDRTRTVWIKCYNKKGRSRIKKARISAIHEHDITFNPVSSRFAEITYKDEDIPYIGFTSAGRVIIALVGNVLIITTVVVVVMAYFVLGGFFGWGSGPGRIANPDEVLIPFKKNIDFLEDTRWRVRIVEVAIP